MKEKLIDIAFQLISIAGDAKQTALLAIQDAKENNFGEAYRKYKEAKKRLTEVHVAHTELIQMEAGGQKMDLTVLLVHSQDHLTSAITVIDLAGFIINLFEAKK